jgi:hypothetical protein
MSRLTLLLGGAWSGYRCWNRFIVSVSKRLVSTATIDPDEGFVPYPEQPRGQDGCDLVPFLSNVPINHIKDVMKIRSWRFLTCATVLICTFFPVPSGAQSANLAYVIAGPAAVSGWLGPRNSLHAAGGGELGFGALGLGGELGYWSSGLGMGSVNGSVSSAKRASSQKTMLFLTAGYTTGFTFEGGFNAWNVGAGANYWISERRGFRVEFRDHIRPDNRGTVQYWSLRAGVAFR